MSISGTYNRSLNHRFMEENNKIFISVKGKSDAREVKGNRGMAKPIKRKKFKMRHIMWWNPPLHSTFGDFCENTTIGGLRFLAKRKRHISERIFWLISLILGVAAATYLINDVFVRYNAKPVIVTFSPKEKYQNEIPFPAVTICSMNKFPKTYAKELERRARELKSDQNEPYEGSVGEELVFTETICKIQRSFSTHFNYSKHRGKFLMDTNGTISGANSRSALFAFMFQHTLQCDKLIRLCLWQAKVVNCSMFFKRIATDYGRCCTFNMLPTSLLYTLLNNTAGWTDEEMLGWRQWNYAENLASLKKYITFPRRQKKAGLTQGLSILVDANTHEYFCPISDSEGFRFVVHSPLERAQVFKFGSAMGLGKEIFIRVLPEVILADPSIKVYEKAKRKCVLGNEMKLDVFQPYTKGNCLDECTANIIAENCSCIPFSSPSRRTNTMCLPKDAPCIAKISYNLYEKNQLDTYCGHCVSLCENIKYDVHISEATLQDSSALWKSHATIAFNEWADNNMSIAHIFLFSETTIPKFRTKLYGVTDLIANTGGILGLCLGVSVISIVETIYFFTLRILCITVRRKTMGYRVANLFWVAYQKHKLKVRKNKHVTFEDI